MKQKYRMHRRHILPKEDDRRWPQRDQTQRSCYPHKPIMAFPPYHSNHVVPVGPLYPMWGAPPHPANIQMWGSPGYPPWQPAESWHWKPYPGVGLLLSTISSFLTTWLASSTSMLVCICR